MKTSAKPGYLYKFELDKRLLCILERARADYGYGYIAGLAKRTGIRHDSWRNLLKVQNAGKQRPTHQMIQSIAREYPEYAFWLATGLTHEEAGHISPIPVQRELDETI